MIEKSEMQDQLNVLSLEDSDLDFEIISEQLIKAAYNLNILRAETERDFTSLIQSNTFDIIIADYNLPQFDAFEALKICNLLCPDVPFICVSGSIGEILAIELLKLGAVDYVLKDRLERLPFAIKRAIEEKKEKIARRQIEESLRQSEEKYRTIFENVQDVFYQTDLTGIIKEISPSIKHFLDFNTIELIGKPVIELYDNPVDRKKLLQILNEKGEVRDYEIRLKTKNHEVKYASINARLIFNAEGIPDHIDGALRDISERKLAEDSLKQSEERLRDIVFTTADWVWEIDEKGFYTYSSLKGIELFDIGDQSILGKTPFDFMPQEEANRVAPIFAEYVAKREPIKDLENWNFGKNGELICLLTNGLPILNDEGHLIGYRGVDKNITERKRSELELIKAKEKAEESEQKYKQIFDNTFDFMSVYEVTEDHRFKVITFNPSEEKLIGSLENYQNKYIDECIPAELYNQFKQNYERCIKEEKLIVYEEDISFQTINKTFHTQLIPLQNTAGRVHRIIVISRDITDIKLLNRQLTNQNDKLKLLNIDLTIAKEKAEESNRLKTAFINNISHEIRTPMNGILGFGQFLVDTELTIEERREYYAMLKQSGNRLMNTVSDYMDMARIVSGTMEVHKKEFLLQPLFKEIIENTKLLCAEKKIGFEAVIPREPAIITLFSDGEIIRKTLSILLDNALKFTNEGSISCGYLINPDHLEFFVKDGGVGIAPDKLEKIFDMFSQEDNSNTRGYEGSGLGLTIAQGLVKLLGGTIKVTSKKGEGSTFTFTVPYKETANPEKSSIAKTMELNDTSKLLVLIAEDEESNYIYMQIVMKKIGCKHIHAVNGAEAVEMCKQNKEITLVLMDIKMPVMNGLEATQLIHAFRPELPIIATTAYAQTGDEHRFLDAGFDGFLPKPLNKDNLMALLHR